MMQLLSMNIEGLKREDLLDEINDIKTDKVIQYYPFISRVLDLIKDGLKDELQQERKEGGKQ